MKTMLMRQTLSTLAVAVLLAGCGAKDPSRSLAEARSYLAEEDTKAAIITLKSALQQGNDSGEIRFLLGQALLASGEVVAARVELQKAIQLGHPADVVVPFEARTYVMSNEYDALIARHGQTRLGGATANADLQTSLALAYINLGRFTQARQAADAAFADDPKFTPGRVLRARLRADSGDLPAALAEADRIIAEVPGSPDAWQLKGDLVALGQRDFAAALEYFRKALEADPKFVPAYMAIMSYLLAPGGDLAEAKAQQARMAKALPNNGMTRFYEAFVALRTGDSARAQEIMQALLRVAPDNPHVLRLAGLTEFSRGTYARAASLLAKLLLSHPNDDGSRRLLAATRLRLGQADRALSELKPLMERPTPDGAAFKLAAQAEMQLGNVDTANKHYARAAEANPKDTGARAAVAYGRVRDGDVSAGLLELQSIAAADDGTAAELPLVATLMQERKFDAALMAIDRYEKKAPKNPLPVFLRAHVLLAQGDAIGARAAYERALELQPAYFLAADALAKMDLKDGKPADAHRRFDDMLKADPRNVQAMMAIAKLKFEAGASNEEIAAGFAEVVRSNPSEVLPRLALINFLLAKRDVKAALQAAQQADAAVPDHVDIVEALGRAQAANGDTNQAVLTYNKLIQLRPNMVEPYLRLADAQWAAGKRDASTETLKRALLLDGDHLAALRALFDAYIAMNRADDALAVARQVQKRRPELDVGYLLEGTIPAAKRKWDEALQVYRAGLNAAPDSADLAERVHVVLTVSGQHQEAARHADEWLRGHPRNVAFAMYLGDLALSKGDEALAVSRYREVLRREPNTPLALNNLAWLLLKSQGAEALKLAQRANEILPDRPVLMDTLSLALAGQGRAPEGVELLRRAMRIEPNNPQLRLNLAKLMIQAGDKTAARTELEALVALGDKFPRQGEVSELLKKP